ncbi:MAG TPA: tetratricopeptide repeat protein [Luteolibacter sp.]|nr:tetratricopeptide repeat protein [Luteolibacter sp.]
MFSKSLLLFVVLATTLRGGDATGHFRLGDEALAAGLWEIAAGHYEAGLSASSLDESARASATIRLAEARLRDGRPAEALDLLDKPGPAAHPEAPFWIGQALAAMGRTGQAIDMLTPLAVDPLAPFHAEAVFTIANLELALGEGDQALRTLDLLDESDDTVLASKARLREVGMLLDAGRVSEAREALPAATEVEPWDAPLHTFLEAMVLLRENRPADAVALFRNLIERPQGQSLARYHLAATGLGEALFAAGQSNEAAAFIVSFLQDHPDTPRLEVLFHLLRRAAAQNPETGRFALEALAAWTSPGDLPVLGPIPVSGSGAVAAWPSAGQRGEIAAHAMLARALILRHAGTPETLAECRRLLTRLRFEFPAHPLASRSLVELARIEMDAGSTAEARALLETVREISGETPLHGRAAFLEGRIVREAGNEAAACRLFREASLHLPDDLAAAARFNALVLAPAGEGSEEAPADPGIAADVRLERALSLADAAARIAAIEEFLIAQPEHVRAPEARLAAAEAALAIAPPDLSLARAQLDTLAAEPEKSAALDPSRLAMVRLRLADLEGDTEAAIAIAREIGTRFPDTPAAADAAFVLGRSLFRTEAYNEARLVLEQVAATTPDTARAEAAMLLAARSAALVPTSQSQQEALALFRKVIDGKGPLAPVAILENARLMIDMNRLAEAEEFLRGWFEPMEKSDPMRLPAGLLLGEAIYARGSADPESLPAALAVYDSLLEEAGAHSALFNRLQYLRGRTLEQIPDERAAFSAYYSVLETDEAPAEWHYFELCGFRALALLEKAGRWPAAIACARRIASFNGPRAAEAAERASQLQLSHMIWEE